MDLTEALQRGYYSALEPLGYPVYMAYAVPEIENHPFILVSNITYNQLRVDRPCIEYEAFVTVQIITGHYKPIGNSQALDIAYLIEGIINPDDGTAIVLPSPYIEAKTFLQNSGTFESKSNNRYIYNVVKTYRHLIAK